MKPKFRSPKQNLGAHCTCVPFQAISNVSFRRFGLKNKLDEFKCDAFDYRIENSDAGLRGHRARPSGRKGRAPWARCTALGLRHRARAGPFTPTLSLRPAPTPVRQAGRPGLPSRNDIAGPGGGGGGGWMGRSAAADGLRRSAEEVHRAPAAAEQQQAVRTRAPAHAAGTPGRSGLDGTGPSRAGSAAGTGKRARSLSTNHGSTTAVVDPLPGLAPSRLGEGMTRKTLARLQSPAPSNDRTGRPHDYPLATPA